MAVKGAKQIATPGGVTKMAASAVTKKGKLYIKIGAPLVLAAAIILLLVFNAISAGIAAATNAIIHDASFGLAGTASGVPGQAIQQAESLVENSRVPAVIMGSIPFTYGNDPTAAPKIYPDAARVAAIKAGSPLGAYEMIYNQVASFDKTIPNMPPIDFAPQPNKPGWSYWDDKVAGAWLVTALDNEMTAYGMDSNSIDLTNGTIDQPQMDSTGTQKIADRQLDKSDAGKRALASTKANWIKLLAGLPIANAKNEAPIIYDTAFKWYIGQQSCNTSTTISGQGVEAIAGDWTNPIGTSFQISSPFGPRNIGQGFHVGVDLPAPAGTPVYAAASGVIHYYGQDPNAARYAGSFAIIQYVDGSGLAIDYEHLDGDLVPDGTDVKVGTLLGHLAARGTPGGGDETGPHLHFGINTTQSYDGRPGSWVDPVPFMGQRGVTLPSPNVGKPYIVSTSAVNSVVTPNHGTLSGEQITNANLIIGEGSQVGADRSAITIALATSIDETVLKDPSGGNGTSAGPFQETDTSIPNRTDVAAAAGRFYARLNALKGWEQMQPVDAIWIVQQTPGTHAMPSTATQKRIYQDYANAYQDAQAVIAALGGAVLSGGTTNTTNSCQPWTGNPLSGGLGTSDSGLDGAYTAWKDATGDTKTQLAKIALQPRTIWFGDWEHNIKQTLGNYVNGFKPDSIITMAFFTEWAHNESLVDRTQPLTAADIAYRHQWIRDAITAIGNRKVIVLLNPDLPIVVWPKGAETATREALTTYEAQQLSLHPNITTYIDAGDQDWLTVNEAADLLENSGIQYVRGFGLGTTHYSGASANMLYASRLSQKLAADGFTNKHAIIDTAASGGGGGNGFTFGQLWAHFGNSTNSPVDPEAMPWQQFGYDAPTTLYENPTTCKTQQEAINPSSVCVSLGQPPTLNVTAAQGISSNARADINYVDAFLWFGRPWLDRQDHPFNQARALDAARSTPFQ